MHNAVQGPVTRNAADERLRAILVDSLRLSPGAAPACSQPGTCEELEHKRAEGTYTQTQVLLQACALLTVLLSAGGVAAQPTREQLAVAEQARGVKVYVYDLAAAGLMPPLDVFAPGGQVCSRTECEFELFPGATVDMCNYSFGRPMSAEWAEPFQVSLSHGNQLLALLSKHSACSAVPWRAGYRLEQSRLGPWSGRRRARPSGAWQPRRHRPRRSGPLLSPP